MSKPELRTCFVGDKRALFHGWSNVSMIREAIITGSVSGVVSDTYGIVEFEDGNLEGRTK